DAARGERAWGWRSSPPSSRRTEDGSRCAPRPARARRSPWCCRATGFRSPRPSAEPAAKHSQRSPRPYEGSSKRGAVGLWVAWPSIPSEGGGAVFWTSLTRELRRRRRQAIVVALGLALGVGLVVTVSSTSSGVTAAQSTVLHSLYG